MYICLSRTNPIRDGGIHNDPSNGFQIPDHIVHIYASATNDIQCTHATYQNILVCVMVLLVITMFFHTPPESWHLTAPGTAQTKEHERDAVTVPG